MIVTEEFNVRNAAGKVIPLEFITPKQVTYLDYGYLSQKLPKTFNGYRLKNTDIIVEKQSDDTFVIPIDKKSSFRRV